jgi:GTPase
VAGSSKKLVTFLDLCGHEKYLKTTMFGLVGLMPDYCMVIVGANMGVSRMTKEHLGIALALKIPLFIVITKIDIAPKNVYEDTINTLVKIMKNPQVNKAPIVVKE